MILQMLLSKLDHFRTVGPTLLVTACVQATELNSIVHMLSTHINHLDCVINLYTQETAVFGLQCDTPNYPPPLTFQS